MKRDLSKRLRTFIESQGMSVRKFEQSLGIPYGYVKNISSGISTERFMEICGKYPSLNGNWLLTGEGPMLRDAPSINQTNVNGSNTVTSGKTTIKSNTAEAAELQSKIRELEMEKAHLQSQLAEAKEWNLRLFELLKDGQKQVQI